MNTFGWSPELMLTLARLKNDDDIARAARRRTHRAGGVGNRAGDTVTARTAWGRHVLRIRRRRHA